MHKILFILIFSAFSVKGFSQKSFYDLKIKSVAGNTINLSDYKNKTVLIVNTALNSIDVSQLQQLENLYQQYKGKGLIIIAVPSNDFLNEPKPGNEIAILYKNAVSFVVAEKSTVTGANISSLYKWLSQKSENGSISNDVKRDFQKFLISKEGKLVGVFSGKVNPANDVLRNAINNN